MSSPRHRLQTTPGAWPYGYVSPDELRPARRAPQQSGIALVVVITSVAILAVFVAELAESTTTDFHVAQNERDRLKAEYLAKSGLNLTRLLIAAEPDIRRVIAPFYQMLVQRQPPQLNVWDFADTLLAPFADLKAAKETAGEAGVNFSLMEGVTETGGTFEVVTVPENSKINVNKPLFFTGDEARKSIAMQLFALLGGYQSPESPYDPMFSARDPDGHYTTRLDVLSNMIDWWDYDEERTVFDPGSAAIASGASEDNIYDQFADPYSTKNAPFDSVEELRLIRGVGDDFWATFVESDPEDPRTRQVTIYASGAVNANLAPPQVLLARLCSFVPTEALCINSLQAMAFIQLFNTVRAIIPIPLFTTPEDFLAFVTGKPGQGQDLYATLSGFLGAENPLMAWTPVTIPADLRPQISSTFLTEASIFTIQSSAFVGRTRAKMSMVVNFDKPWVPPQGVPGSLPKLGVAHHYRLE